MFRSILCSAAKLGGVCGSGNDKSDTKATEAMLIKLDAIHFTAMTYDLDAVPSEYQKENPGS